MRRILSVVWQQNLQMKYYEKYHCNICNILLQVIQWNTYKIEPLWKYNSYLSLGRDNWNTIATFVTWYYLGSSTFRNLSTISRWLIHVSKLAYDFKIIGTMTKLRQVSESTFATRKFMYCWQVDIIPHRRPTYGKPMHLPEDSVSKSIVVQTF